MKLPHLPTNLRFDGVMACGARQLLQFTELDQSSPSHGCSFYIDAAGFVLDSLIARRAEKRAQFAQGIAISS